MFARLLELTVRYAPCPTFFIMGLYELTIPASVCTSTATVSTMVAMWFLMSLAHAQPYIQLFKRTP